MAPQAPCALLPMLGGGTSAQINCAASARHWCGPSGQRIPSEVTTEEKFQSHLEQIKT